MLSTLKLCGNVYNVFQEHPHLPVTESGVLLRDNLPDY